MIVLGRAVLNARIKAKGMRQLSFWFHWIQLKWHKK